MNICPPCNRKNYWKDNMLTRIAWRCRIMLFVIVLAYHIKLELEIIKMYLIWNKLQWLSYLAAHKKRFPNVHWIHTWSEIHLPGIQDCKERWLMRHMLYFHRAMWYVRSKLVKDYHSLQTYNFISMILILPKVC